MLKVQQRVCAVLMEERATSRTGHCHHISVRSRCCIGLVNSAPLDVMGSTVAQDALCVGIPANQPDTRKWKSAVHPGKILQHVVGAASVALRLRNNCRQRILSRPCVNDLYVVNNPIAGSQNAATRNVSMQTVHLST